MTPDDALSILSDDPTEAWRRIVRGAHDAGGEFVLRGDSLVLVGVVDRQVAMLLQLAAGLVRDAAQRDLEAWPCQWCSKPSELPDEECTTCYFAWRDFNPRRPRG